jgi:hypothetical protein
MKELQSPGRTVFVLPFLLLFAMFLSTFVCAQGVPEFPDRRNPSNDCGCSRGDDGIALSSGMLSPFLPKIPNLELGYLYYFGNNVRTGRFTADYVLPFHLSCDSVLFGEAHAEGWDFRKRQDALIAGTSNRVDLSFGGGYRRMLGPNTLVGVNGFYDASRVFNTWRSSGGVGLEYAANVAGDDAVDLNFNWYGNLFNRDVLINAFRNKGGSFDVEAGYSHALFDHALDLRLKLVGYQFDIGTRVWGWRGGADLTTRNGMFTLRYEYGHDRIDGDYNTIGGFATVGFQLENLLYGESPITFPEPVFRSPRDLRRLLGLKVKRNWHQPTAVTKCDLRGSVLIAPSIPYNTFYTNPPLSDPIPPVTTRTATVCWCNLTSASDVRIFVLVDDSNFERVIPGSIAPITLTPPSGCITTTIISVHGQGPTTLNGIVLIPSFAQPPLTFGPGGGISVQVNQ